VIDGSSLFAPSPLGLVQPAQDLGKLFRHSLSDDVGVYRTQFPTDHGHRSATELRPGVHFSYSRRERRSR